MTSKTITAAAAALLLAVTLVSSAEEKEGLTVKPDDTVKSVLERSVGQTVGLRVGAGEEIRGKVARVGDEVVHLSELAGREFFDAVVPIESIDAVIVRARSR
jgi:hypothetical protein